MAQLHAGIHYSQDGICLYCGKQANIWPKQQVLDIINQYVTSQNNGICFNCGNNQGGGEGPSSLPGGNISQSNFGRQVNYQQTSSMLQNNNHRLLLNGGGPLNVMQHSAGNYAPVSSNVGLYDRQLAALLLQQQQYPASARFNRITHVPNKRLLLLPGMREIRMQRGLGTTASALDLAMYESAVDDTSDQHLQMGIGASLSYAQSGGKTAEDPVTSRLMDEIKQADRKYSKSMKKLSKAGKNAKQFSNKSFFNMDEDQSD